MDTIARLHAIAYELETDSFASPTKTDFRAASNDNQSETVESQQSERKISYPFEPSLSKERCNLCRLHFSRETVNYKVPIHRIMELKKTWDEKGGKAGKYEGRRYNFPSYLYTTTSVCLFCSQFFATMPDERIPSPAKADLNVLNKVEPGPKLEVTTELQRTNIAEGRKAYQSSEVDYKFAEFAVTPPYEAMTRTAREVDPWWEVDLGRKYSLESINFQILIGIRQNIDIYIFLLDKPIGFDNPFLDNLLKENYPKYRITFKGKDKPTIKEVNWKLPANAVSYAIRIQLKGIQTLSIQKFFALQGSDFYLPTEEDLTIAQESFAALRPEIVEATIKEKQSFEMKALIESGALAELINNSEHSLSHDHSHDKIDAVANLKAVIQDRYIMLAEWKERVLKAASAFTHEEISSLYRIIFRYTSDLYPHNKENLLNEHDLLTTGITLFYPRCDLFELHSRIRSILYWIQTRSHLKTLGPLINCNALNIIANNSHEPLFKLMTIFKRIDYYWLKKEEKEKQFHLLNEQSSNSFQNSTILQSLIYNHNSHRPASPSSSIASPKSPEGGGLIQPKVSEFHGCSWAQFLIIMSSFVSNQCDNIPYNAFNIDHPKPNAPIDDQGSQYTFRSGDAMSNSSYSVSVAGQHFSHHHKKGRTLSKPSSRLGSRSSKRLGTPAVPHSTSVFSNSYSFDRLDQPSWGTNSLFSPTQSMVMFQQSLTNTSSLTDKTLLDSAKETGKVSHAFDSSFAEYRFSHFKRRQRLENQEFPKELDLEFAKTLIPKRPTTTYGATRGSQGGDGEGSGFESEGGGGGDGGGNDKDDASIGKSSALTANNLKKRGSKPTLSRANTAALKDFMSMAGLDEDHDHSANNGHIPARRTTSMNSVGLAPLIGNVQNLLASPAANTTVSPLKRQATVVASALKEKDHNASMFSLKSSLSTAGGAALASSSKKKSLIRTSFQAPSDAGSANNNNNKVSFNNFSSDDLDYNYDDFDDFDENSKKGKGTNNQIKNIDFFRICGLCELRLPRDAIEMKVFRKHIVKLRSTWNDKLVSKEVRSLDNTISMYNLVYVCYFCAQYFDPDFPDGIAYPTRIANPKKKTVEEREKELEKDLLDMKNLFHPPEKVPSPTLSPTQSLDMTAGDSTRPGTALGRLKLPDSLEIYALTKREETLTPFYDTRHLATPNTVGEVFSRPDTRESRKKAFRALEVVQFFARRREQQSYSPPK